MEAERYQTLKSMTAALDRVAAARLNGMVRGDVLSVGGVWDYFVRSPAVTSLTVLDMSHEMLEAYCPVDAVAVRADLYEVDFADHSFDTIVFPLMLHHTAQGSWRECEDRVEQALDRAARWVRSDGRVVILEYCPQAVWTVAQRVMLPLTRRILARAGQPLVAMHSRKRYEQMMRPRFGTVASERITADGFDPWTWYPVFMSSRWLRVPLGVYPRMHVISS
jgi:ubiquinone/menaquinone biosynthesis C-methylase UbiE